MSHRIPPKLITPPLVVVIAVRQLLAREGLARTAQLLGIGSHTVQRFRGGLPVHRGTYLVVRAALAPLAPEVHP